MTEKPRGGERRYASAASDFDAAVSKMSNAEALEFAIELGKKQGALDVLMRLLSFAGELRDERVDGWILGELRKLDSGIWQILGAAALLRRVARLRQRSSDLSQRGGGNG